MQVYTLRFKSAQMESNLHLAMIETNCRTVQVFFYHAVCIFVVLLVVGILTQLYQYCLLLGGCIIAEAFAALCATQCFPYFSKRVTQGLSLALCVTIATFLFFVGAAEERRLVALDRFGFVFGAVVLQMHQYLAVSPRFVENVVLHTVIVLVYTLSVTRQVNVALGAVALSALFFASQQFIWEKKLRQLFWSMEKYFIWYYIANFVMPTKLIISHCAEERAAGNPAIELVYANSAAKKRFNLANSEELHDLADRIELRQVISVEEDQHKDQNASDDFSAAQKFVILKNNNKK